MSTYTVKSIVGRVKARLEPPDNLGALILKCFDVAQSIAFGQWQRHDHLHATIDLEELQQAAMIGLVEAAHRFESGRGVDFCTFAWLRIRGAVLDEIRRAAGPAEADRQVDIELTAQGPTPEQALILSDLEDRLPQLLSVLDDKGRALIARHHLDGESLAAIGQDLGLSRSRASRRHKDAMERLRMAARSATPLAPALRGEAQAFDVQRVEDLLGKGMSKRAIARLLGMSPQTLRRRLKTAQSAETPQSVAEENTGTHPLKPTGDKP